MQNSNEAVLTAETVIKLPAVEANRPRQNETAKLPRWVLPSVVIICVLPFLLNTLGVDFTSSSKALDLATTATLLAKHWVP